LSFKKNGAETENLTLEDDKITPAFMQFLINPQEENTSWPPMVKRLWLLSQTPEWSDWAIPRYGGPVVYVMPCLQGKRDLQKNVFIHT
jgi:hypothetical protein